MRSGWLQFLRSCMSMLFSAVAADRRGATAADFFEHFADGLVDQSVVERALRLDHVRVQDDLLLAREVRLDVALQTPEQERLQDAVELLDNLDALVRLRVIDLAPVAAVIVLLPVEVEPRLELREAGEDVREEEVQERPELGEVVLQGRAGEQELVRGRDALQLADQLAVEVFQPVPSSTTRYFQLYFWRNLRSAMTISNDVTITGNDGLIGVVVGSCRMRISARSCLLPW